MEAGAAYGSFSSFEFCQFLLSEDAEGGENAEFYYFAYRPIIVNLFEVGVRKVLLVVDFSLVHQLPTVDVKFVWVVDEQVTLFFYFHFSLF